MINALLLTDGYKTSHHKMYPEGTTMVFSNWTPRNNKYSSTTGNNVLVFGIQMVIKQLHSNFQKFFESDKDTVIAEIKQELSDYLGMDYDVSHFEKLHDLGYLPISIRSLDEGTLCPIGQPMLTIYNTHPDFYWLTNFLETYLSMSLWKGSTSATISLEYNKVLKKWAEKTDKGADISFQAHDFSMRGMDSLDAVIASGMAHLTVFKGSDSLPAIHGARKYYNAKGFVAGSVPASEHSVMSAGGKESEVDTFKRLLNIYPKGILSVVSDTWDLWKVCTEYLPQLKEEILNREGKLVVRPDCYDEETEILTDRGWVFFKDLLPDDLVAQVNDEGVQEFVKPLKYYSKHYEGDMYHFKNHLGTLDLLVTPNHRMITYRNNKESIVEAQHLKVSDSSKYIKRSAASKNLGKKLSLLERLQIAFQADGSFCTKINKEGGNVTYDKDHRKIRFHLCKERKIDRLKNILGEAGIDYKEYVITSGGVEIEFKLPEGWEVSKTFNIPSNISEICSNWAREFIEEVSYWDATRRHDNRFKFDTTNVEVADKVAMIAQLAGYGVTRSFKEDNRKDIFSDVYTLHIRKSNKIGVQHSKELVNNFSGTVYCVQVPSGRIVVRRNRCTAVCGNSGDPVDILCGKKIYTAESTDEEDFKNIISDNEELMDRDGDFLVNVNNLLYNVTYGISVIGDRYTPFIHDVEEVIETPEHKGVVELLWDVFGGTINEQGYKVLHPCIGAIYGDSITLERAENICQRLADKGFASTNVVYGVGSFSMHYNTRDTYGFAMKATYTERLEDGQRVGYNITKDPVTDSGKKSSKGLLAVINGEFIQEATWAQVNSHENELKIRYFDGHFGEETTFDEIRSRVANLCQND